jgi:hypothetical protein
MQASKAGRSNKLRMGQWGLTADDAHGIPAPEYDLGINGRPGKTAMGKSAIG